VLVAKPAEVVCWGGWKGHGAAVWVSADNSGEGITALPGDYD
jgi:hypothetical protein